MTRSAFFYPMKIISLQSENVKCLRAVEITPGGDSVEIAGKNGAGKSSVLDSIFYALGGQKHVCERPIRDGESSAKIVLELDDYTVTRTFTASGGGSLTVRARDERKIASPQAVLDTLVGDLAFDPLAFTRLKPEDQTNLLRKLVGIDTTVFDQDCAKLYEKRTEVNREIASLNARINGRKIDDSLPAAEIDAKDIIAARAEAVGKNDAYKAARYTFGGVVRMIAQTDSEMSESEAGIELLKRQLQAAEEKHRLLSLQRISLVEQRQAFVQPPDDIDVSDFDRQLLDSQSKNAAIRANNELIVLAANRTAAQCRSVELTKSLENIAAAKEKLITEAKYPVPGLGFSSTGAVTYNGVPFEQLSTAQRLKISAAIGIALNPKLRVMLIRDGSAMDETTLAELITIAKEHDTQLWIERVGKLSGELPGVVIEDGSVVVNTLPGIPDATNSKNTDCV